jgi:hypothetical protein
MDGWLLVQDILTGQNEVVQHPSGSIFIVTIPKHIPRNPLSGELSWAM